MLLLLCTAARSFTILAMALLSACLHIMSARYTIHLAICAYLALQPAAMHVGALFS